MKKLSVSLTADHVDALDERQENGDASSRSAALRDILDEYETVRSECEQLRTECEDLRTECEQLRTQAEDADDLEAENERLQERVDDLETELEHREARVDDLRRQLQAANSKDEKLDELAKYVERERAVEQRWREAGLWTRAKWKVFGMPSEGASI